jgi:K+-sensing histidine kinase KdpD
LGGQAEMNDGSCRAMTATGRPRTASCGYLFATFYALVCGTLVFFVYPHFHPPRLWDVFLVGVAFAAIRYGWRPALCLYVVAAALALWVYPPADSFRISSEEDYYRLGFFSASSAIVILVGEGLRFRLAGRNRTGGTGSPADRP